MSAETSIEESLLDIGEATVFLEEHPELISNEIIFKGLRRLVTKEANGASIFDRSELDEYLAAHPEENFLLRIALGAYATTHGLLLIEDGLFSKSVREGRAVQENNKKRSWFGRVSRAVFNLDAKETTTLILEHQRLAGEVVALENKKLELEDKTAGLTKEAGVILVKAHSEAQEISTGAQTRAEKLALDGAERTERMLKDALAHISATHQEKSGEIEKLVIRARELGEEIEIKKLLAAELSQNPEIVKEWEARRIVHTPGLLRLDRSQKFNPTKFQGLGKGWSIWKGPADKDGLQGEEDQDARALVLQEMDLSKVLFETCLKNGESSIKGEEKLKRLKESGHIRLDALVFQTLWENQDLIPESWKEKGYIFFDGAVLRSPNGNRSVLYLYWYEGEWHWHFNWLAHGWDSNPPSAVLASI